MVWQGILSTASSVTALIIVLLPSGVNQQVRCQNTPKDCAKPKFQPTHLTKSKQAPTSALNALPHSQSFSSLLRRQAT